MKKSHGMIGTTSVSQETNLQYILSDVPIFAVGVFAFGACTFFLIFRRLNAVVACLHVSIFVAFIGAILDLAQVLARGNRSAAAVQNVNPFLALTIAREVAYALSFGLRFLFLWGFVACPPLGQNDRGKDDMHSGRWGRWGITGHLLRWMLFIATVAITALQVILRVYTPLQQVTALFSAEGALESSVSAIFILKIFLNMYLAALDSYGTMSRLRLLLRYAPALFALLLSAGIGVGNVLEHLFSETILGRFLQGVELYILVLYTLVDAFHPKSSNLAKRRNRTSSFHNMPSATRSSEMLLGPPRLSEPKFNPIFSDGIPFSEVQRMSAPAQSYTSMVSTWFTRKPSKSNDTRATPRIDSFIQDQDQDQAERGVSPIAQNAEAQSTRVSLERSPTEPNLSPMYRDPVYSTIVVPDPSDPVDPVDSVEGTPIIEVMPAIPARVYSREYDQQPLYPPNPPSSGGTDSPIYGLYGVNNPRRSTNDVTQVDEDPRQYFDKSARSSGISVLLRQQEELDRSIAALQIFSRSDEESRRSSATQTVTPNGSHRFSLSNFPEPPWGRASVASTAALQAQSSEQPTNGSVFVQGSTRDSLSSPLPPPLRPRIQSLPSSEVDQRDSELLASSARDVRINSSGTQYEITSFIGHLTHPRHMPQNSSVSTQESLLASRTSGVLRTIPELTSQLTPQPSTQTFSVLSEKPGISVTIPSPPVAETRRMSTSIKTSPSMSSIRSDSTIISRPPRSRPVIGLPAQPRLNPSPLSARPEHTGPFVPMPF